MQVDGFILGLAFVLIIILFILTYNWLKYLEGKINLIFKSDELSLYMFPHEKLMMNNPTIEDKLKKKIKERAIVRREQQFKKWGTWI